jgi:hypothetical protein
MTTTQADERAAFSLEEARKVIRDNFLQLAEVVVHGIDAPEGFAFADKPAWELAHQLSWNMGCPVRSSEGGLSVHGAPTVIDESDVNQCRIEIRYLHPSMLIRDHSGKVFESRKYNDLHSAVLFIDQGRPFFGMYKSLIGESDRYPKASTIEDLSAQIVTLVNLALAQRNVEDECVRETHRVTGG